MQMKNFTKFLIFSCFTIIASQAIAVTDVNGDMLDDIVRMNQGNQLNIQYQTAGGGQFTEYYFGQVANNSQWMLTAADCNNNGFADFMTGDYDHSRYIIADDLGLNYTATEYPGADFFAQAANFSDINNDGLLDMVAFGQTLITMETLIFTLQNVVKVLVALPMNVVSINYLLMMVTITIRKWQKSMDSVSAINHGPQNSTILIMMVT